jgi:hypothetical protein
LPSYRGTRTGNKLDGGTVEKFIGDAVMAVFGAPVAHEDDAERAVRSGLRILEAIEELNTDHPALLPPRSPRRTESPRRAMVAIGHGIVYFQTLKRLIERNVFYCSSRVGGRDGYSLKDASAWLPGSASFTGPTYANGVVYSGRTAFPPVFGLGLASAIVRSRP